jgi:hypothetical protein
VEPPFPGRPLFSSFSSVFSEVASFFSSVLVSVFGASTWVGLASTFGSGFVSGVWAFFLAASFSSLFFFSSSSFFLSSAYFWKWVLECLTRISSAPSNQLKLLDSMFYFDWRSNQSFFSRNQRHFRRIHQYLLPVGRLSSIFRHILLRLRTFCCFQISRSI